MQSNFDLLEEQYDFSQDIIKLLWKKYGDRTEKLIQALKKPCTKYALRVNTLKTNAEEVVQHFKTLDIQIEQHPLLDEVVFLPVNGPFPIPEYKKKVVVDKFAAESIIQGADLFAPGALRAKKIRVGDNVTVIDKTGIIVASGVARMTAKEMLESKHGLAVEIVNPMYKIFSVRGSEIFKKGYIYDQSFPSILVSRILDPQADDSILDLCTAPGGKATHIAQLMQNRGNILAVDRSRPRLMRLKEHISRLGITNIEVMSWDSRHLPEKYHNWADRVLIDPPCSALGVRPKIRETTTLKEIVSTAVYQRQFLKAAVKYVRPNGILVYCTCTLTTEENESNIKFLIDNFNCKIIEQHYFLGSEGERIEELHDWQKLQRFYPDLHDTPGYFIAKMQMRS